MADITDLIKKNGAVSALAVLFLTGGGFNVLSENAETAETEKIAEEFRQADVKQDDNYDALLQMLNDLNLKVALLEQELEE